MRVISRASLREFSAAHPDADKPLTTWWKVAPKADWRSIQDVRRAFPHADAVELGNGSVVTVFNIGRNKYRLITGIVYDYHIVYVKMVLTHKEYDRGNWKVQLCRG